MGNIVEDIADLLETVDADGNAMNLADVIQELAKNTKRIASAIAVPDAAAGQDATGGHVECMVEAVMGVTAGLCRIADEIGGLADAVKDHGERVSGATTSLAEAIESRE